MEARTAYPGCEWRLVIVIEVEVAAIDCVDLFPATRFLIDNCRIVHGHRKERRAYEREWGRGR